MLSYEFLEFQQVAEGVAVSALFGQPHSGNSAPAEIFAAECAEGVRYWQGVRFGPEEGRDEMRVQTGLVDLDDLRDARVVVGGAHGYYWRLDQAYGDDVAAQRSGVAGADGQGA